MQALNPVTENWWSPKDQDAKRPVKFKIRTLTGFEQLGIGMDANETEPGVYQLSRASIEAAIACGLVGWQGVLDENGDELPFKRKHVNRLPPDVLPELAAAIINASDVGDDEKKT